MNHPDLLIATVVSAPFDENAYIVGLRGSTDCVIVDPSFDTESLLDQVDSLGLEVVAIFNTHGHSDHIAGNAASKARWPAAPLIIGEGDASKLTDPVGNLSAGFGVHLTSPPADQTVKHGEEVQWAGIRWAVRATPGHSCGHVIFVARQADPVVVLGGDVLFAGSVGRSDFPDSDPAALSRSIRDELYTLDDTTIVLPGHGPPTTIGRERVSNPFVRGE
jgi:glyoxylase-like metal-dependent hydrolase (beta-lactamase superfamily II)